MEKPYCGKFYELCPFQTPYGQCALEECQPDHEPCKHMVPVFEPEQKLIIKYLRAVRNQNEKILRELAKQK